jgi:enoyl-CoA hydratase
MSYKLEVVEEGFLLFTINRAEKRNAINYEVMDGLELAMEKMEDDSLKALIITGEGDQAFCSGGDISVFQELKTDTQAYAMLSRMSKILAKLLFLPKPTLALMNGTALGGGCELASACDFRIARRGMKAGYIQGKLAITTGWGGGTILFEKMNPSTAMKLLFEAKPFETKELVELGFLDAVYEGTPLENGMKFIQETLTLEASVLKAYKSILVRKWAATDIESRMNEEVKTCSLLWAEDAHHEQVIKFLANKKV